MKRAMKQSTLTRLLNGATIIFSITAIISFMATVISFSKITKASEERYQLTLNANRFMDGSSNLTTQVRAYAATGNQEFYDNYWNEVNVAKNREAGVSNMQEIGITTAEQQKIDKMSVLSNNLVPLEDHAMQMVQDGKQEKAVEYVFGSDYQATVNQINAAKTEFLDTLSTRTAENIEKLSMQGRFLQILTGVQILLCILLQVIVLIFVDKKLISPVVAIKSEMEEIAKGNLSAPFDLQPDESEIGLLISSILSTKRTLNTYIQDISEKLSQLADGNMTVAVDTIYIGDFIPIKTSILKITDSLNNALSQIRAAAYEVSTGSNQVSEGSQHLAEGAAEQANSVEQLSRSVEHISEQIRRNAQDLNGAQQKSTIAADAIYRSNDYMQELLSAMEKINRHSNEIGKIIKTIEDIAFQTNILALNAAVESARAGAAGKGFAVVADEVRNLAGKSAAAANDTVQLINDTVLAVDSGTKLANQTAEELKNVVANANDTSSSIIQVTEASNQQAEVVAEVCSAIEQISSVVQINSATSEESAAAAVELQRQANIMQNLMQRFHLKQQK